MEAAFRMGRSPHSDAGKPRTFAGELCRGANLHDVTFVVDGPDSRVLRRAKRRFGGLRLGRLLARITRELLRLCHNAAAK
jgi:hypothetical protein